MTSQSDHPMHAPACSVYAEESPLNYHTALMIVPRPFDVNNDIYLGVKSSRPHRQCLPSLRADKLTRNSCFLILLARVRVTSIIMKSVLVFLIALILFVACTQSENATQTVKPAVSTFQILVYIILNCLGWRSFDFFFFINLVCFLLLKFLALLKANV